MQFNLLKAYCSLGLGLTLALPMTAMAQTVDSVLSTDSMSLNTLPMNAQATTVNELAAQAREPRVNTCQKAADLASLQRQTYCSQNNSIDVPMTEPEPTFWDTDKKAAAYGGLGGAVSYSTAVLASKSHWNFQGFGSSIVGGAIAGLFTTPKASATVGSILGGLVAGFMSR